MKRCFLLLMMFSQATAFAGSCTLIDMAAVGDGSGDRNFIDLTNPIELEVSTLSECITEAQSRINQPKLFKGFMYSKIRPISSVEYDYEGEGIKSDGKVSLPYVQYGIRP